MYKKMYEYAHSLAKPMGIGLLALGTCTFCVLTFKGWQTTPPCLPLMAIVEDTTRARFGLDIGGTLSKVVYFEPDRVAPDELQLVERIGNYLRSSESYGYSGKRYKEKELSLPELEGTLHFIAFETSHMSNFFKIVTEEKLLTGTKNPLCATGGGAYKYKDNIQQLGVNLHSEDEMTSLIHGIDYMLRHCPNECYYLKQYLFDKEIEMAPYEQEIKYPYLVVNIGSGASILKVDSPGHFERIGGSALGGGTFYGLSRALADCSTFEEALELASQGRATNANLLVKDIYGGDYDLLNLSGDTVASYFGKLVRHDALSGCSKSDMVKALLLMVTNNISSISNLYAFKVTKVPTVIYTGSFLRNNVISLQALTHGSMYWSNGKIPPLFMKHEGFFGAIGSMAVSK